MKTIKISTVIILLISIISCKKQQNSTNNRTSNTNNTQSTSTYSFTGTWVNNSDATDYFYLNPTTNGISGNYRYILTHFSKYDLGQASYTVNPPQGYICDTVLQSTLITPPGYEGANTQAFGGTTYAYFLLFITPNMIITQQNGTQQSNTIKFTKY